MVQARGAGRQTIGVPRIPNGVKVVASAESIIFAVEDAYFRLWVIFEGCDGIVEFLRLGTVDGIASMRVR